MLTERDLILLRAALTYFDEELSPHGANAMSAYFEPPLDDCPATAEIASLRSRLQRCRLQYLCCDAESVFRHELGLCSTLDDAEKLAKRLGGHVATVLFPAESA